MSIKDRVSDPESGDLVTVKFITGEVRSLTYVDSVPDYLLVADEQFQYTVPSTSVLWMSKPLKEDA